MRVFRFWRNWGLIPRLMLAVGVAIVAAGGVQTALLVAEGRAEHSARLFREQTESLVFLAPLVADQALVGEYAAIGQLLKNQVKKGEIAELSWTDKDGKTLLGHDAEDKLDAPAWFARVAAIEHTEQSVEVTAGGVGYGTLTARMTPVKAQNRLWQQFVKQLQIVAVTLFLMLQFIWLIFRGNLGTLRMLAEGANRFSQGDHAVRIDPEGAPEVQLAAEGFNNMANNTERLIASLGESESKNKLLATIVEQSSEAIFTRDLAGHSTSWNSGAAAMFGYTPQEAVGRALNLGRSTPEEERQRTAGLGYDAGKVVIETVDGRSHAVMTDSLEGVGASFAPVTVPDGKYFLMGDHRDDSFDSRFWGFADRAAIVGRASAVALSFDFGAWRPRWNRFFSTLR